MEMEAHSLFYHIHLWLGNLLAFIAGVEMLILIIRKPLGLHNYISVDRIELTNRVILLLSIAYTAVFCIQLGIFFSGEYEQFAFYNRAFGKYFYAYLIMFSGKMIFPHLYWFKSMRTNLYVTFFVAFLINLDLGAWLERFIIIITSYYS